MTARLRALRAMRLNYRWAGVRKALRGHWYVRPYRGKRGIWILIHDPRWMAAYQQAIADGVHL